MKQNVESVSVSAVPLSLSTLPNNSILDNELGLYITNVEYS